MHAIRFEAAVYRVMWSRAARTSRRPEQKEESMSSDEKTEPRDESESTDEEVVAHGYVADEPSEDDPERKLKRKQSDDAAGDDFGRKRK